MDCSKIIQAAQYENVGTKIETRVNDRGITSSHKMLYGLFGQQGLKNGTNIIEKENKAAVYTFISLCGQHGYRKHNTRALLALTQNSILFTDEDTPNSIIKHNFWTEQRLIFLIQIYLDILG